jgi:predicted glutamine amidotransferase
MCLLTYLPPNVQPDAVALLTGARANSDGHGYAIVVPGEDAVRIGKSMDAATLVAEFVALRAQYPDGPALFHSRLTTHGATDVDNCHPFVVNGDPRTVVAHNGILCAEAHPKPIGTQKVTKFTKAGGEYEVTQMIYDDRSDTRILADDLLMSRWPTLDSRHTRKRLTRWLGRNNKILVLTTDPAYRRASYLFNAELGMWQKGAWYSNTSFRGYGRGSTVVDSSWWREWDKTGSRTSAVRSSVDEADREGWEEFHYGYRKNARGYWEPSTDERWKNPVDWEDYDDYVDRESRKADDAASWPTTLGGTRVVAESGAYIKFVTCDLCGTGNADPETGLCLDCWACQDCYEYLSGCHCYGTPRPSAIAYKRLTEALDHVLPATIIRTRLKDYRAVCASFDALREASSRNAAARKASDRGPLAITAKGSETALSATQSAHAEIDAVVDGAAYVRLQDDPEAPAWARPHPGRASTISGEHGSAPTTAPVVSVSSNGAVQVTVS